MPTPHGTKPKLVGVSEWNYDIPIAYKLLVTCNPQVCRSSIWKFDEDIAIAGEYEGGVHRLMSFLDQLPRSLIQPLQDEARESLMSPENRRRFFILECGEIFEMRAGDRPSRTARC